MNNAKGILFCGLQRKCAIPLDYTEYLIKYQKLKKIYDITHKVTFLWRILLIVPNNTVNSLGCNHCMLISLLQFSSSSLLSFQHCCETLKGKKALWSQKMLPRISTIKCKPMCMFFLLWMGLAKVLLKNNQKKFS